MNHWCLPIRQRWAENIFEGSKTLEIRRGRKSWAAGDWQFLYAVAPVGAVVGVVVVSCVRTGPAGSMRRAAGGSLLSEREYWRYARQAGDVLTFAWLMSPVRLAEPRDAAALGVRCVRSPHVLRSEAVHALLQDAALRHHAERLDALSRRLAEQP